VRGVIVLLIAAVLLLVPAAAARRSVPSHAVAIFYYPWWGTPAVDGKWQHWQQNGHTPPRDVASRFYPARGAYSSSDAHVVGAQMREIAHAGVSEIVASWWGRGSPEDDRLPLVLRAARAAGLTVAVHLEPYDERTIAGTATDIAYLRSLGISDFFVYHATDFAAAEWDALTSVLHGVRLFAQTPLVGWARNAGFEGVYTYDIVTSSGRVFTRLCVEAHAAGLLCAPSVGPGYDARRATADPTVKPRRDGSTYDAMWTAALRAHPDLVTVTSYNEWHEGTQIEAAVARTGYEDYDGAWGRHGRAARGAYLVRTRYWTAKASALHP
jgi:Glycosyl hydrolase family 99